jgi:hypothetical protein
VGILFGNFSFSGKKQNKTVITGDILQTSGVKQRKQDRSFGLTLSVQGLSEAVMRT